MPSTLVCVDVARVCLSVESDAGNDSDASSSDDGNPQNGGNKGAQQKGAENVLLCLFLPPFVSVCLLCLFGSLSSAFVLLGFGFGFRV